MILDNARETIFLVNSKGDFAYANDAASRTYGYSRDEFLNLNIRQLLRPEDEQVIAARLKEVIEKGQIDAETVHVRKDGSLITVTAHHNLVKTLHGQFIISVMRETPKTATR
jgi:PAS domain S-box-containing protein